MASFAASVQKLCTTLPAAHKISDEFFEQINLKSVQLRPYQTAGLQWLMQRYLSRFSGCLLGDDMGLGKTLQSVSFLLYLKSACRHGLSALIVCPLSVTSQWMEELKKCVRELPEVSSYPYPHFFPLIESCSLANLAMCIHSASFNSTLILSYIE